jgi:hypothetical protein
MKEKHLKNGSRLTAFVRDKVTTTNFTTLKTKKNIKKFVNPHYIEM